MSAAAKKLSLQDLYPPVGVGTGLRSRTMGVVDGDGSPCRRSRCRPVNNGDGEKFSLQDLYPRAYVGFCPLYRSTVGFERYFSMLDLSTASKARSLAIHPITWSR